MTAKSCHLLKTMKSFNIDKVLRTGSTSGSECRLGTFRLSVPIAKSDPCESKNGEGEDASILGNNGDEDLVYRTPLYFIHTQTGTIPHITPEVLQLIYPSTPGASSSPISPVQISIDSTMKFADPLCKFGKGIGKFVGLPNIPVFLSIHDSLQPLKTGHNDKFGIALWSRHGRTSLTPENFAKMTFDGFKPSLCQILSDYDVHPKTSGMKRLQKSLSRAEEYAAQIIKQNISEENSKMELFLTIEAAWFEMNEEVARKTVASLLESQHHFAGILIAGLHDRFTVPKVLVPETKSRSTAKKDDDKQENKSDKRMKVPLYVDADKLEICSGLNAELLEKIVQILPTNLPKYVPGPFVLADMVEMISKGVDIVDTSIATKMADLAKVLILDKVEAELEKLSRSTKAIICKGENEGLAEMEEGTDGDLQEDFEREATYEEGSAVVSLKDKQFFADFRPLSSNCNCYTCRKHTRSYIHHLYATDELLGPVLVQIHNFTAIDRFFVIIRGIVQDTDNFDGLQENLGILKKLVEKSPKKIIEDHSNGLENSENLTKAKASVNGL